MIGLSTTAIGMRPMTAAIEIYHKLQEPLSLEYLELAIGTCNDLTNIPPDVPLVIHDRALYQGTQRLPFSLMNPNSWCAYRSLTQQRSVLALSIHPPRLHEAEQDDLRTARSKLEDYLEIPVLIEVMPSCEYHNSKNSIIPAVPLLLDVSHINLWYKGDVEAVKHAVKQLLPHSVGIHLSHNNGKADSHELIPREIWFSEFIEDWGRSLFVTYESLPEHYQQFERLDKQKRHKSTKN
ncbi:hypothetical protein ACQ4M3_35305 [Leptolyngbya sp. AN03gr2]|uniref:hypothetical protein n=1 Tax=unclassified Leptolyngbya TaxID=2650499 RepID=UPI003D31FD0C